MGNIFDTGIRPAVDAYLAEEASKVMLEKVQEKYPDFKGTEAEYKKLHKWVRKTFHKPSACEGCGTKTAKRYDWASIDHKYTKEKYDWEYLCRSCHIKSDGRINQLKKGLEGAEPRRGWNHTEETKAKMRANHWSTKRAWIPRERNEHGHFI